MRFSKAILLSAATMMLPFLGQATPVDANPHLTIADLNFTNFSCVVTSGGHATPGGCGSIDVMTINQPGNGIQFSSGFSAYGKNSFSDAQLSFDVKSVTGIDQIGLDFNGMIFGRAIASVTETAYSNGMLVGTASVACLPGEAGCRMSDTFHLNGVYTDLFIKKDIQLDSYGKYSASQISYVDQTFSLAPEPSSIAMLGTGLLGAAGLLRRRAKSLAAKAVKA